MRSFCISHSKDVDGIGSAALVLAARGGGFKLTGYDEVLEELEQVPAGVDSIVLCDIGMDQSRLPQFVDKLGDLARRCEVTYIDHHYLSSESEKRLTKVRVKLVHDVEECASMLTYQTFRKELPEEAKKIALYGAVTDYMDASPLSKKMIEKEDRLFVLLEATLLSNSVAERGDDMGHVRMLAEELSKMKQPHEIDEVPRRAASPDSRFGERGEARGEEDGDARLHEDGSARDRKHREASHRSLRRPGGGRVSREE